MNISFDDMIDYLIKNLNTATGELSICLNKTNFTGEIKYNILYERVLIPDSDGDYRIIIQAEKIIIRNNELDD